MSLTKKVYLTISGYDIKLSDNLTFYQKDQLKLIFYINEYGIDYENNATARALMPVNPLNAILFIENPEGVDSVSSAKIEDNAVTFYLSSEHTQYIGVSRMQLRLFDQDGCAITLPHFTFEIRENIYGSGDVRFQNVVMVDQTGTVILTEDNDMLDVGDILTIGPEVPYPQVAKTIKELPVKHGLDGTEKLIVEDNEATKQAPLTTIVDEIKQNSQEKIREIESELAQTNAQLSTIDNEKMNKTDILNMSNLGQDVKEAMTGGSVAVVGANTILSENIVDGQVTFNKRTHSGGNIVFFTNSPFNFDTASKKLINQTTADKFGLNYGNGHKSGIDGYYFSELQLSDIGYLWYNTTLTGSNAFIATHGDELPQDADNCILFGFYDFYQNYFYLNGIEFTVNNKPYIDYIFNNPYKANNLTGEFAMVFSIKEPNFDTINQKLMINNTCGVETRWGHFDNEEQELLLSGNGYIGYDTLNGEYVCLSQLHLSPNGNLFTPDENVVLIGYYSCDNKKYYLSGNYLIDGKKPYESYAYSKAESDNLISSVKQFAGVKTNQVILHHNSLKTHDNSEFDGIGNVEITGNGFKFINNDYIVLNKEYSVEQRKTNIKFTLSENGVLSFFYKVYEGYALGGSLFTVDGQNNKMIIHEQFADMGQIPSERVATPFNFIVGREYDLTLIKEKRKNIMMVTDMVTGESKSIETDCTAVIGDLLNEFAGGRQNGRFGVWSRQGSGNYINNLYITTRLKEPLLYITGDSICEGDRCEIGYRYSDRVEDSLGKDNVAISGMSGTKITGVMNRLKSELSYIKPKYCMVTIGTNGGNTRENIQELIDYIESIGVTPILNHVSQTSGSQANNINAMIDEFSDYVGCKFDRATSLNNDINQYYNSSLYGDGVHPNKQGHEKMFDRFKTDVPYLIY